MKSVHRFADVIVDIHDFNKKIVKLCKNVYLQEKQEFIYFHA